MTSKLKQVREQPLLNPPPEREWWMLTPEDRLLMRARLRDDNPLSLANMLYWMKDIGQIEEPTSEQIETVMKGYARDRPFSDSMTLAEMHANLSALGKGGTITGEERGKIEDRLTEARGEEKPFGVWRMLNYMRKAGLAAEPQPKDLEALEKGLKETRLERGGGNLIDILALAHEMGVRVEVTAEDWGKIRDWLEDSRKTRNGYAIARIHHQIKTIGPPPDEKEAQPQQQMPPLKRYKG